MNLAVAGKPVTVFLFGGDNMTELEKEYAKQRRRIKQFIKRAEKRGYTFEENAVPKKPKNVTKKSVERLQKITPEKLYKKSTYNVPNTDVFVNGSQGVKISRKKNVQIPKINKQKEKQKLKKARERVYKNTPNMGVGVGRQASKTILDDVLDLVRAWTPDIQWSDSLKEVKTKDKNILERMLNSAISQHGFDNVARALNAHADEVNTIVQEILYSSGGRGDIFKDGRTKVNADLTRLASILKGSALTVDESIEISEQVEYYDNWEDTDE